MAHPLSDEQIARIRLFIEDEWVVDSDGRTADNLRRLLAVIESPAELHWCAVLFNWDTGCETLRQLIDHRLCDRGTALAVFWLGQPCWHYGRSRGELREDARAVRALLEEIEGRYCGDGFAHAAIRVDPTNLFGEDFTRTARSQTRWHPPIPAVMFEATPGTEPPRPPIE